MTFEYSTKVPYYALTLWTRCRSRSIRFQRFRLRSCLFCEGRISVLKRWFKTPIQNALHGSTVHASLEKKTISWACTAHCSRLLFELKWTGKAFIWRHLNVVICDFAFMLPPESAFCSNHDRKRTFLGCVHAYFAKAESAFWNADSKRRSKTPFTGVLFMLPSRRRRFREHALRIVRGYCSSSSEPERRFICDFAFMLPPESAFCSNHDRKRTFLGVLNQRFETTFIRK